MSCVGLWFFLWLHEISFMNPYMKFMNARFFFRAKRDQPSPYGPNEAINALEEQMKAKSDDELRGGPQGKCVFLWVGCLALGVSCLRKPYLKHQKKEKKRKEKEHQPGFVGSAEACRYISCMICILLEKNTKQNPWILLFGQNSQLPGVAHAVPWHPFPALTGALTEELKSRAQSGTALEELLPEAFALVREAKDNGGKTNGEVPSWERWHIPSLSKVSFSKDVSFLDEFPFPKGGRC